MTDGIFRKKGISFIGAVTIILTMFAFHDLIYGHTIESHLGIRSIIMVCLYFLIALASEDFTGVDEMIRRVWSISTNGMPDDEKYALIKSFLEVNVAKWNKYWILYQEIVNERVSLKWKRFSNYISRIPRGNVNLQQLIWILGYIVFNVFTSQNIIPLEPNINFIIDLVGLAFFLYTSSGVIGLNTFMTNIFESIKPSSALEIKDKLCLLESHIMFGARQYGFLKRLEDRGLNDGKNN